MENLTDSLLESSSVAADSLTVQTEVISDYSYPETGNLGLESMAIELSLKEKYLSQRVVFIFCQAWFLLLIFNKYCFPTFFKSF
jgi:hypothetical protein